jgi:hypothetical protein
MKRSHRSSLWNLRKAVSPTAIHLPADPTGSTTTKMCYLCTRFKCHPSPRSFKKELECVPPLECSPPARRRRVHRRCLASRLDVVLNVMSACLASSRGSAPPRGTRTDAGTETGRAAGANRRRLRSELRPHPKEEAMSHAQETVLRDGRRPSATQRGFPRAGGHGDGHGRPTVVPSSLSESETVEVEPWHRYSGPG